MATTNRLIARGQLQDQARVDTPHPHPCRVQQGRLETMSTTIEIKDSVYAKLLVKSLPAADSHGRRNIRVSSRRCWQLDEREGLVTGRGSTRRNADAAHRRLRREIPSAPQRLTQRIVARPLMEERGLKHKDIWPVLGNKGSATEILSGPPVYQQGHKRSDWQSFFHVPVDLFI